MNKYLIELHLVQHEIAMYLSEIQAYGTITQYNERYPTFVWIESLWEIDIIMQIYGAKKVWEPSRRQKNDSSVLKDISYERGLM